MGSNGPIPGTLAGMPEPAVPTEGTAVLHLFCHVKRKTDRAAIRAAVAAAVADEYQVVPVALLGHKADLAFMIIGRDLWRIRHLQSELRAAGLKIADSYVSLTEVSEYAQSRPDDYKQAKLYPQLPPEGLMNWCFYGMSRTRDVGANWYTLDFEERRKLMGEHGGTGRAYRGRVVQLITGSSGIDDYEWGVTLFARHPDDLKEIVYEMRYDRASSIYGIFGPFFAGTIGTLDEVLDAAGVP